MNVQQPLDPQNRVSDCSKSPQEQEDSRRQGPQQQRKEQKIVLKSKPVNHSKPRSTSLLDSDEEDEELRNEPGTSSITQPTAPMLPYNSGDEDGEYSDEYSAHSRDSERTLYYPDLCVLRNDAHWTMTLETRKYAAAAGSFCFPMTVHGEQQDICNVITMPCAERSLYLNDLTNDFDNMIVEVQGAGGQTRDMLER